MYHVKSGDMSRIEIWGKNSIPILAKKMTISWRITSACVPKKTQTERYILSRSCLASMFYYRTPEAKTFNVSDISSCTKHLISFLTKKNSHHLLLSWSTQQTRNYVEGSDDFISPVRRFVICYFKLQITQTEPRDFQADNFEENGAITLDNDKACCKYSLRHRKCGFRGYIHELFVSKPERVR